MLYKGLILSIPSKIQVGFLYKNKKVEKEDFLYPRSRYYGQVKSENLLFNANLQEFAQKVNLVCNLETVGKIITIEAYEEIKALWKN